MRIIGVLKEDQEFNLKDFISDAFSFEYYKNHFWNEHEQ
jgi:hypothetical protein